MGQGQGRGGVVTEQVVVEVCSGMEGGVIQAYVGMIVRETKKMERGKVSEEEQASKGRDGKDVNVQMWEGVAVRRRWGGNFEQVLNVEM